jgi:hypothetical protein
MTKHSFPSLLVLAVVCCLSALVSAQSFTGSIVGTVKNPNGEVVPGAEITITHLQTNKQVQTVTNGEGYYVSPPLAVGDYRVEAKMAGYRHAVRNGISIQIQQTLQVDFALEVGAVAETVEVTAQAPILETTSSALGKVVDNRRILDLPLNTRNVYSLIFLTPGVTGSIGNNYNSLSYSVNGARPTMMDTVIDGVTASFPTVNGFTGISIFPSVDAIQEFKVLGATYPAEFGRSLGSVLNVVFKSGTNQFHGSAYEFLRNSVFDANNFFDNRRGQELGSFKRSQFGGHATGPIKRDKTFFMGSYEGLRARSFASSIRTVPTLEQRAGDFSKTFNQAGALIRIFNPFTTRANPSGGFIRDQFTDNKIPQNLMDPVALNILKYFPLPNQPGDPGTGANNYASSGSSQTNLDNYDFRIDHRISERQTFFARYSHRYTQDVPLKAFPEELTIAEGRVIQENRARNFVAEYTNTLSPTMVLTARIGFARTLFVFSNQGLGFKPSSLGLPAAIDAVVDRQMFPAVGVSGMTSLGGNDHRFNAFMSYPMVVNLTRVQDKHNWKYGGEFRPIRVNVWEARNAGTFNFNAGFTQGPNPTTASSSAGFGFASFLLGAGTTGNTLIQGWKNVASQSFYYAAYAQDDWRVTNKLTLNLGIRYDLDTPRTERYNRMNYFDPDAPSPLASKVPQFPNLKGGVVFVGVDGNSRAQYHKDTNNLAPRLGLAYQINDKTVVRAGYSHIFGPSNQAAQGTIGPFGFRIEYPWQTTNDNGLTPFNLLRNPYPQGFRALPGAADGLLTQVGANLQSVLQDTITPWSQQWNLNVQRQLPWQISLEVAYVGTRGLQLSRNGEDGLSLNQLDPQYLSLGSALNQSVPNPFVGLGTLGFFPSATTTRAQLLRPYPQFTDIIPLYSSGASSNYHALQVSFSKRLSRGLMIDGNYTWAKNIEEGLTHQDSYNLRGDRGLATIDIAHRFVISYLYELPFGKGRKFGAGAPGILDALIGGWQFNGITTFQSGTPLTITANNTAGIFNPLTRPNTNGKDPNLDGKVDERLNRYFDTSVYSQPAAFTFGNVGPTVNIRNDGVKNFDLSLFKQFAPIERLRVQFRVEALNAFNTPRFGSPNTSVTSTTFGQITSQANSPRQLQFGLKLLW